MARKIIANLDLTGNEIQNVRAQNLAADPGSPSEGLFYWHTGTKKWRVYDGAAWTDLAGGGIPLTLIDAKGDLIVGTADNTAARKAVGADGTILFADSTAGGGITWRVLAATDVAAGIIDNTKLASMAQSTIKGRAAGAGTGDPTDLTASQVKTLLAYAGTDVAFTPAQNIAATNVQAAIEETVTDLTALINTVIEGRKWKDPVDAATTAALAAVTYNSGAGTLTATANGALANQDGVVMGVGDDLLVKDQASTFQNGIYTVAVLGDATHPFILQRRADANTTTELTDATTLIQGGVQNTGDVYTQTTAIIDLTSAAQTWTKSGEGSNTYFADGVTLEQIGTTFRIASGAAGAGLTGGAGAALDVNAGAGLEVSGDAVRIAASAAGAGLTGGAGSALAVGAGTGIVVNADDVAVDTAVVVRKSSGALTGGATSEVLTHNLNTRDVDVTIRNNASPYEEVEVEVEATSVNTVTIRAAANLPASYRWLVIG
jgi:hypothetical protein